MRQLLVDAHCHLQMPEVMRRHPEVMRRASQCGLKHIAVCGTSPNDWNDISQLYETYPDVIVPNFGVHPWYLDNINGVGSSSWERTLRLLLQQYPKSAVGECGLDKCIKKKHSLEFQSSVVKRHLSIAEEFQRPISLHCVGSWGRLRDDLASHNGVCILHACNAMPPDMISLFLSLPATVYFSLNCNLGNSIEHIYRLASHVPLSRLLLETDAPGTIPSVVWEKMSSEAQGLLTDKTSEPCLLRSTVEHLSAVLQKTPEDTEILLYENFCNAFGL